jgi:site-specific DNA-methyltransferase (adenine-specific)
MKTKKLGTATLYLCDCMKLMATLPDKSIDLAIVDPPYFKGPNYSSFFGSKSPYRSEGRYPKLEHWNIPGDEYYNELLRVSKNQIIFGINYFNFPSVPPGRIVWDKKNDKSTFSNGEIASCSLIKSVRFFRYMWRGFIREGKREKIIHPTQKPVALYKWLLSNYAKPGMRILDTHLGSGSIAIACNELGYSLTASEIDKNYFNAACKRIKETIKQYEKA